MDRSPIGRLMVVGLLVLAVVSGCSSGGGVGGGDSNVRIEGLVDDGTPTSPVANAICRFVDMANAELANTTAGANGIFSLRVAPNVRGFIECHPPGLPGLKLAAFASTMGRQAGDVADNQDVTPATTIIVDIISTVNPADPEAEEARLLAKLTSPTPDIALLVDAATALYNALLDAKLNADFAEAFDDLCADGALELSPLVPIAPPVEQAVVEAEQRRGVRIKAACAGLLHINVAPTATADTANTLTNTPVIIPVLHNDFDDNLEPLTITSATQGVHGTVSITDTNTTVTYTPSLDFAGTDTFTYIISDPVGLLDTAKVTVSISDVAPEPVPPVEPGSVNHSPVVANPLAEVMAEAGTTRALDLTATFTDPDGDALTLAIVTNTNPQVVTATVTRTTITLHFQESGTARLTVRAADPAGSTVTTDFTVAVTPAPPPPPQPPPQTGGEIGRLVSFAGPPPPAPDVLSSLPISEDGRPILIEVPGLRIEYDETLRNPVSANLLCRGWIMACLSPPGRTLDDCVRSAPVCATNTPWLENQTCCPATCYDQYKTVRLGGSEPFIAFWHVFHFDGACFPGLKGF